MASIASFRNAGFALLVVAQATSWADVRIVGPGQAYTNVQQAIIASITGDTILVRPGSYPGFTIDTKIVSVIGDAVTRPTITGTVTVRNAALSKTAVIGHLLMRYGFVAYSNAGSVRVADCQIGLPDGNGSGAYVHDNSGGTAFVQCSFYGAKGNSDEYIGSPGELGLHIKGAAVAVYDCTVRGGNGGSALSTGGLGGDGARVAPARPATFPAFLHASGSTFTGGTGGDTYENLFDYLAVVGSGGDGLEVASGAFAWRLDDTFVAGSAGMWHYCYPADYGSPGQAQVVNGFAADFVPNRLTLAGPTLARESTSITLQIQGDPGDLVYLRTTVRPAFDPLASWRGVRLTSNHEAASPSSRTRLEGASLTPLVKLDGAGQASVTLPVPALDPGLDARTIHLQVHRRIADGSVVLGGFLPLTIVDSIY